MKSLFTAVFAAILIMGTGPLALASDSAKEAKDSFDAAADETGDGFKEGWDASKKAVGDAADATGDAAKKGWDSTKDAAKAVGTGTKDGWDSTKEAYKKSAD